MPWGQQASGGWPFWGFSGGPASSFKSVGPSLVPVGDLAMPLGKPLTIATWNKILKGGYVDVFSLLFCDLENKDKDKLDDCLREHIKCHIIDRTYAKGF